jgi:hypothetical protein
MKRVLFLFGAALASLTSLTACNPYNYNSYYYDYGYYDPYYYYYDTDYAYGWYDPYGVDYYLAPAPAPGAGEAPPVDLTLAAAQIAVGAPSHFNPGSCVVATAAGTTVSYQFDGCQGQFSGRRIDGTLVVDISQVGDQLVFSASGPELEIDGVPHVASFRAAARAAGAQRVITIDSTGYTPGQTLSRRSSGTLVWNQGDPCVGINGQGSSAVSDLTVTSSISGLTRCAAACPGEGIVVVSGPDGAFSSSFEGLGEQRVIGPQGNDRTYNLQCL